MGQPVAAGKRRAEFVAPRDPLVNMWVGFLAIQANRPAEAAALFERFGGPEVLEPREVPDPRPRAEWSRCGR